MPKNLEVQQMTMKQAHHIAGQVKKTRLASQEIELYRKAVSVGHGGPLWLINNPDVATRILRSFTIEEAREAKAIKAEFDALKREHRLSNVKRNARKNGGYDLEEHREHRKAMRADVGEIMRKARRYG
ncbi:hypothetical protein ACFLYO_05965 [Chloroflexota bacterium]